MEWAGSRSAAGSSTEHGPEPMFRQDRGCQRARRLTQRAGTRRSDHAEPRDDLLGRRSDVGQGKDHRRKRHFPGREPELEGADRRCGEQHHAGGVARRLPRELLQHGAVPRACAGWPRAGTAGDDLHGGVRPEGRRWIRGEVLVARGARPGGGHRSGGLPESGRGRKERVPDLGSVEDPDEGQGDAAGLITAARPTRLRTDRAHRSRRRSRRHPRWSDSRPPPLPCPRGRQPPRPPRPRPPHRSGRRPQPPGRRPRRLRSPPPRRHLPDANRARDRGAPDPRARRSSDWSWTPPRFGRLGAGPDPHRIGGLGLGPFPADPVTIYGSAQGLLEPPISASVDEAENLWVVSQRALYLLAPGAKVFRRYTAQDGLHYGPMFTEAPDITLVEGGAKGECFVGYYARDTNSSMFKDAHMWTDPWAHKGKMDQVLLEPDGSLKV